MKRKKIKNLPTGQYVKCCFCKEKTTNHQCVGYPYYGKTVCNRCFKILKEQEEIDDGYMSLGEEQAYRIHKVF